MEQNNKTPQIRFKGYTAAWKKYKYEEIGVNLQGGNLSYEDLNDNGKYKAVLYGDLYTNFDCVIKDIKKRTNHKSLTIQKNDILFPQSTTVDSYSLISPACLNEESAETSGVFVIRPNKDVDGNFICYYSKGNEQQRKKLSKKGQGLTIVHLYYQSIKDETIMLPSIIEQKQISEMFLNLDNHITLLQRKYDKLVNVKKSMLDKMFPKDGETVPEIRFKGFTDPWKQCKLGELGSVSMCHRIFKEQTSENGEIPFYKIGTFGTVADAFISKELFEEYKSKYPYPSKGDILISASGSIGRTVEFTGEDEYFQDSNIVWLNHDERISNSFLSCFYSVVKWAGIEGSTIKRLYNDNILNTLISLPSICEQEKIGAYFSNLDNLITINQRKLEKLKNIKKSCLEKMFI